MYSIRFNRGGNLAVVTPGTDPDINQGVWLGYRLGFRLDLSHTVYWESSAEEKVCKFRESGSIHECFLALFYLTQYLYI